jgi:Mg/Co/Ni transporter MgtE
VVDSDGVLVGIVTVDDVLDVQEEEATEDFHRVGSVGRSAPACAMPPSASSTASASAGCWRWSS